MDGEQRAAAARSTAAAITTVSDTVEDVSRVVRRRVRAGLAPLALAAGPLRAVDESHALVHGAIRTAVPLAGRGVGAILQRTAAADAPRWGRTERTAGRAAALAAAFGDRLPPELRPGMSWSVPDAAAMSPRVLTLVHGLGGHSGQWGSQYVAAAIGAGFTPVLVDYNTGLAITANGAEFDRLLTRLVREWPSDLERIVVVGHSMGGLVATAAFDHAAAGPPSGDVPGHGEASEWTGLVSDVVTLGTPHTGAALERVSDLALRTIALSQVAAPIAELGHLRSRGIKDLAAGWHGSLPDSVRHHAVAAHIGRSPASPVARLLGDGIVGQGSAAGRNTGAASVSVIALGSTNHNALLDHTDVCAILERVLAVP
jgi:pimeloyl-ACP methyl ester carboxylesterase